METIAISAPVASAAVQTATQTQAGDGQVSFAQLIYGLNGGSSGTGGQQQAATGDLSWREMQAMSQMLMGNLGQTGDGSQLSVDALLSQLLGLLGQMQEEDVAQALGGEEDAGEVLDKIDKLRRQLEQWMAESGQGGEQMMFLMAQVFELPLTPQVGEDGTITLTLSQSDTLAGLLQNTEPSQLIAKLTGLPAEIVQKLIESQQAAPTNGQAQAATGTTELPVTQVSGTQTQTDNGEAVFQSNIRTAKQQMDAGTAKAATNETEVDADELQRQVDEGVHFKNTSYTSAVQTEAKAEQAAKPLLTQVQDGIIKAIEQGDNKFSIRLVPEGLGELEVRLTKTAEGGMLLNIVTKSAEAQRLLTADIAQLREQMRAYKVEVDSILTEQQDDFLQRQRDFEQQAFRNGRQDRHTRYQDARNSFPEAVDVIQTAQTRLAGTALDTYI